MSGVPTTTVILTATRSDGYGKLLQSFVEKYKELSGSSTEIDTAFQIILKATVNKQIQYDATEAHILSTLGRNHDAQYTGVKSTKGERADTPALLQMYDFIATMDEFDRHLTNTERLINSMTTEVGNFTTIQKRIPPSDLRPWAFHRTFPADTKVMDEHDIEMTVGQQLFEPIIYDPDNDILSTSILQPKGGRIREKTANERAQDEAHLLGYETIKTYFALGQGLFKVEHTPVNLINIAALHTAMDGLPGSDEWATSLTGLQASEAYTSASAESIQKQSWVNGMTHTSSVWCSVQQIKIGHPYYDILTVMPKETDLKRYTNNRFHLEHTRRNFISEQDDILLYRPARDVMDARRAQQDYNNPQYTKRFQRGGPIGMFKVCWPKRDVQYGANTVIQVTGDDVLEAMKNMYWHPIHASANLAVAYRNNGLFQHFTTRVFQLIKKNTMKKSQTPLNSSAVDPTHFRKNMTIASQLQRRAKARSRLRPTALPRYRTFTGEEIHPLFAYNLDSFLRELNLNGAIRPSITEGVYHAVTIPRPMTKHPSKYSPVEYTSSSGDPVRLFVQNETPAALLLQHFASENAKSTQSDMAQRGLS